MLFYRSASCFLERSASSVPRVHAVILSCCWADAQRFSRASWTDVPRDLKWQSRCRISNSPDSFSMYLCWMCLRVRCNDQFNIVIRKVNIETQAGCRLSRRCLCLVFRDYGLRSCASCSDDCSRLSHSSGWQRDLNWQPRGRIHNL